MANVTDLSSSKSVNLKPAIEVTLPIRTAGRSNAKVAGDASMTKSAATGTSTKKAISFAARAIQPHDTAAVHIKNLRIFQDPEGEILTQNDPFPGRANCPQVAELDPIFVVMSHCLSNALRLLEHPRGRGGLIQAGKQYVIAKRKLKIEIAYKGDLDGMGKCVDVFLERMRENFPNVFVTATTAADGSTIPSNWGSDQDKYDPKLAGIMQCNKRIFHNMLYQAQTVVESENQSPMYMAALKNYNRSLFYLSLTPAHEVMHFFTGYMGGNGRPVTPPELTFFPFGNKIRGEIGHWWEGQVVGGLISFWEDPKSPLGKRQTGIPFRSDDKGFYQQVDLKFILSVIDPNEVPDFSKIVSKGSKTYTAKQMLEKFRPMSEIRAEEDTNISTPAGKRPMPQVSNEKQRSTFVPRSTLLALNQLPIIQNSPKHDLLNPGTVANLVSLRRS